MDVQTNSSNYLKGELMEIYIDKAETFRPEWEVLIRNKILKNGAILAGGSILAHFDTTYSVRDLDIFFIRSPYVVDTTKEIDRVENQLEGAGYACIETSLTGLVKTYQRKNNLGETVNLHTPTIQVIRRTFPTIFKLFESFDLCLCQMAFDGTQIIRTKKAAYNLRDKKITVNNISRPYNTLQRLIKYKDRGFNIEPAIGQWMRLFLQAIKDKAQRPEGADAFLDHLAEYVPLQQEDLW